MVDEVGIALQNGTAAANTNGTWNSFSATTTNAALTFWDGRASTWTFTGTDYSGFSPGAPSAGSGDAAWVDEQVIANECWTTGENSVDLWRSVTVGVDPGATYTVLCFGWRGSAGRDTGFRVNGGVEQTVTANDLTEAVSFTGVSPDVNDDLLIEYIERNSNEFGYFSAVFVTKESSGLTLRKGSTFDIETALGTITTATLNSVNVADHITGQAGTTVSFEGAATAEIATSGEYTLTLGDGATTEDITVQVSVVGLASFNINKDGADQGSLTDVEFIILTGAAGSRAINQQITGITTTAGGDTGTIEITDAALDVDDTITVVQQSPTVGGGLVHTATLELI